jgi:hemolysin activation/secretion protein
MLASQEFYLGGAAFGRGYDGGELSGDNGIAGSLELRFDQTLDHDFQGLPALQFHRQGRRMEHPTARTMFSLSSAGAGMRLYLASELQAGVEIAVPLDFRSPANEDRDPRVFFFLSKSFKLCPGGIHMRCS